MDADAMLVAVAGVVYHQVGGWSIMELNIDAKIISVADVARNGVCVRAA